MNLPRQYSNYILIAGLYLAQGLPGGLMAYTLPTLLREQNVSLTTISMVSLFALPWALKLLWARPLDQSKNRKRLFMMTLFSSAGLWFLLSLISLDIWLNQYRYFFFGVLLLSNFMMASQDVLTDGLVIRLLDEKSRGLANSFQVVSYKFGMLISGAFLLGFYDQLGWQSSMHILICVLFVSYLPFLFLSRRLYYETHLMPVLNVANETYRKLSLIGVLKSFISLPGMMYWLAILACYKLGDGMISSLTKPFWFDLGVSKQIIAQASGVGISIGIVAGIVAGYFWRECRKKLIDTRFVVLGFSILQCFSIFGYYLLSIIDFNLSFWWSLVLFEQVVDVMSTVIIFTSMMAVCRKTTAGIDYTFQATILLIFSQSLHPVSGFLADKFNYSFVFLCAFLLTLPILFLLLNKTKFNRLMSQ